MRPSSYRTVWFLPKAGIYLKSHALFSPARRKEWAYTGKWLVALFGQPSASSMQLFLTTQAQCSGMALSRIVSSGHWTLMSERGVLSTPRA